MYQVEKSVLVSHSDEEMFTLVDTVENYPKFLPWCGGVAVHERTNEVTHATIHIHYHGLRQHFSTRNSKAFPHEMRMELVEGPFKHFIGTWQFQRLAPDASKVVFKLEYAFANGYLDKLIAPVFNYIASTFVDSFVAEAEKNCSKSKE